MILGSIAIVLGIAGLALRKQLARTASKMFSVSNASAEASRKPNLERGYAIGGVFMIAAGIGTIIWSLVAKN